MVPPLSLWLRVVSPDHRDVRVWLPLFLLWLLLLPLLLLAIAITIVVDVVLFLVGQSYHHYTLLLLGLLQLVAETRGTVVRVNGAGSVVDLTIH